MSPVSVTLHEHTNHLLPPIVQPQAIGSWADLVQNGITLGDTGAPAALDPDDHPVPIHGQAQSAEPEKEREKTWSGLVEVGAVLGEGGLTASEVGVGMKVKLWGLSCGI
jgi:hypothetical protein